MKGASCIASSASGCMQQQTEIRQPAEKRATPCRSPCHALLGGKGETEERLPHHALLGTKRCFAGVYFAVFQSNGTALASDAHRNDWRSPAIQHSRGYPIGRRQQRPIGMCRQQRQAFVLHGRLFLFLNLTHLLHRCTKQKPNRSQSRKNYGAAKMRHMTAIHGSDPLGMLYLLLQTSLYGDRSKCASADGSGASTTHRPLLWCGNG